MYEWIDAFCAELAGAEQDYKPEWQAQRYLVNGKMFAMRGADKSGRPIVTMKLAPEVGQSMRERYPDMIPGYYMNKTHWNSVLLEGAIPQEVVERLLLQAYEIVKGGRK